MQEGERQFLENQLRRIITKLFKSYLVTLEDIKQDHLGVLSEIQAQYPPETLSRWNYLDLPRYSRIRKKVLDESNDVLRELTTLLNSFDVKLKNTILPEKDL